MNNKKPQQNRSIKTRSKIIRTADRIILTRGYHQLTIRGIAREADIGIASIYHYFENKDEIMLAALTERASRVLGEVEPLVPQWLKMPAEAGFRHFVLFLLEEGIEHARFLRAIWTAAPGLLNDPQAERMLALMTSIISMLLRSDPKTGSFVDQEDIFLVSNSIVGVMLGLGNGAPESSSVASLADKIVGSCFSVIESRMKAGRGNGRERTNVARRQNQEPS